LLFDTPLLPQQRLYFNPLPQGQSAFRLIFCFLFFNSSDLCLPFFFYSPQTDADNTKFLCRFATVFRLPPFGRDESLRYITLRPSTGRHEACPYTLSGLWGSGVPSSELLPGFFVPQYTPQYFTDIGHRYFIAKFYLTGPLVAGHIFLAEGHDLLFRGGFPGF